MKKSLEYEVIYCLDKLYDPEIIDDLIKEKTASKPIIEEPCKKLSERIFEAKPTTEDDLKKLPEIEDEYTLDLFYELEICEEIIKSYSVPKTFYKPAKIKASKIKKPKIIK